MPPSSSPTSDLTRRLERLQRALGEGHGARQRFREQWVRATGTLPSEREERRWEKRQQRELRRREHYSPTQGVVYLAAAGFCLFMVIATRFNLWWLVFVALGLGLQGARALDAPRGSGAGPVVDADADADAEPDAVRPGAEADPRRGRVDALVERLAEAFRTGPALLKELLPRPEKTLEALRQSHHELVRRELELRALLLESGTDLDAERERLAARAAAEPDAVARERLQSALALLDSQRDQRASVATQASRLEAESTRVYWALENLHAQALRLRAAGADPAGGPALQQSLAHLSDELDAVAEALEATATPAATQQRVEPVGGSDDGDPTRPRGRVRG